MAVAWNVGPVAAQLVDRAVAGKQGFKLVAPDKEGECNKDGDDKKRDQQPGSCIAPHDAAQLRFTIFQREVDHVA